MSRNSKLSSLRRFLTASRTTRYLVFVLIGWIWLWMVSGVSIFWYVGYRLIALASLWFRPFSALSQAVEEERTRTQKNDTSKEKRRFLVILAYITALPLVFALRFDPRRGTLLIVVVALAIAVYAMLMPGHLIPERWLSKRWNRRRNRDQP